MRVISLLIAGLILSSCSGSKQKDEKREFTKYVESLEPLTLPVKFNTKAGIKESSKNYDTILFQKYKQVWANRPYGKLFEDDSVVAIIDIIPGDVLVPEITTYNQRGSKLDSLNPYSKAGWDIGYECFEYVTINKRKEIVITDSVRRWTLNKEGNDVIEGTDKLTVDTTIYKIDNFGKFVKLAR